MCLAMNPDKLTPGQRSASTSNRNFEGRQGPGGRTHSSARPWPPPPPSPANSPTSAQLLAQLNEDTPERRISFDNLNPGIHNSMEPFVTHRGRVAVLDWSDVNTDLIIPARY